MHLLNSSVEFGILSLSQISNTSSISIIKGIEIKQSAMTENLAQGEFSVDNTLLLTKYLSTTEHEERQVTDSMHLCPQPLYL